MPPARLRKLMSKKKNKKKQKIKYVDDGRTIADMSGTSKTNLFFGGTVKRGGNDPLRSTRADQLKTFVSAMKRMFVPMLVTMGIITVAFGLMYLALILFG